MCLFRIVLAHLLLSALLLRLAGHNLMYANVSLDRKCDRLV